MKLTTAFRNKAVAFHVDFTNEERAIIQERKLYNQTIAVPSDSPPPTRAGDFLAFGIRLIGIILTPIGALFVVVSLIAPPNAGITPIAWSMLIAGVVLFTWGKMKDVKANKYQANPEQTFTLKRLMLNPDFVVYSPSPLEGKSIETEVRETLSNAAAVIRQNSSVPTQTSYEL